MRIHRHPRAVSCAVILPTVKGRHVDYCHCAAAATPSCRRSLPLSLSRSPFSFSLAAKCRQGLAFICMAIAGALWFYRFLVLFHIHAGVSCPAPLLPSLPSLAVVRCVASSVRFIVFALPGMHIVL